MITNMGIFELTFSSQAIALKTREAAAIKNFFFTSHKDTSYIRGYTACQNEMLSETI